MEPALELPSHRVSLPTGVTLRCAERAGEGGETVVLLHGYSDSAHSFDPILPWLPRAWRIVTPDQRGHGDSERTPAGYTIAALAADAAALLDAVGAGGPVTVVGHSMGSFVAQTLALAEPARVRRLVLVGAAAHAATDAVRGLARDVAALADPVPDAFVRGFQESCLHRPVPAAFFEEVVAESRKLPARVWRALYDGFRFFDVRERLHRIACPTLVLWGAHDAIFGRDEQETLVKGVPASRLVVYADSGHAPTWEEPERFASDVAAFVAQV